MRRNHEVRCSHLRPIALAERHRDTHVRAVWIDNRNAKILRKTAAAFDENHSARCETRRHDSRLRRSTVRATASQSECLKSHQSRATAGWCDDDIARLNRSLVVV